MEDKFVKKGQKQLKKMDIDILEDVFEDPSLSGLNYLSNIFVFHSYENEEHYLCVSAKIDDDEKFENF